MTSSHIQPYIFFGGRCEEALEFYKSALGAEVEILMHFNESPDPVPPGKLAPGFEKKVMHTTFRIGNTKIMASDGCDEGSGFAGFSLALTVKTEADAYRAFESLSDGGKVSMPLTKTFWSPCYGMLTDKFGICWMVMVAA